MCDHSCTMCDQKASILRRKAYYSDEARDAVLVFRQMHEKRESLSQEYRALILQACEFTGVNLFKETIETFCDSRPPRDERLGHELRSLLLSAPTLVYKQLLFGLSIRTE